MSKPKLIAYIEYLPDNMVKVTIQCPVGVIPSPASVAELKEKVRKALADHRGGAA